MSINLLEQMEFKYRLFLVLLTLLIVGCVNQQPSNYNNLQQINYGEENKKEFNCDTINAKPQLFYVLGNYLDDPKFVYWKMKLPTSSLNQQKYQLTSLYTNQEYIPNNVGLGCNYGSRVGENEKYLYCGGLQFSVEEISSQGTILSKKKVTLNSVFEVDKNLKRDGQIEQYYLENYAKLISTECTIMDLN